MVVNDTNAAVSEHPILSQLTNQECQFEESFTDKIRTLSELESGVTAIILPRV